MSLGRVSARFLAGVGAWLLGAGAATGGSLLAVSALGQGLAPAPSQQLTEIAVSRALASEAVEATPSPSSPQPVVSTSATPLVPHVKKHPEAPSVPPSAPAPQPTDTVLTADLVHDQGQRRAGRGRTPGMVEQAARHGR